MDGNTHDPMEDNLLFEPEQSPPKDPGDVGMEDSERVKSEDL